MIKCAMIITSKGAEVRLLLLYLLYIGSGDRGLDVKLFAIFISGPEKIIALLRYGGDFAVLDVPLFSIWSSRVKCHLEVTVKVFNFLSNDFLLAVLGAGKKKWKSGK